MARSLFPMPEYYHRWIGRSITKQDLLTAPKVRPKISEEIRKSLKKSKNSAIPKALKTCIYGGNRLFSAL